jgi:nicotinic acid mononucleotide adenylyltransferase
MRAADAREIPDRSPCIFMLDAPTPDVSSTLVRDRLRRRESVAGLVPPLVDTHIHQHHLYGCG